MISPYDFCAFGADRQVQPGTKKNLLLSLLRVAERLVPA
jgi:hypothetical protein